MLGDLKARCSFPLAFHATMTGALLVVQHVASRVTRDEGYRFWTWNGLRYYLDGWSQFDGPEYQQIAEFGYSYTVGVESNIVWFPLYPMLLRAAERIVGDYLVAGIVVSAIAGAAALCVLWRWLADRGFDGGARLSAFLVLALYPYGWYLYGVVHSDGLFLALTVGAFLLVERDKYLAAGIVAALATATRPTGMALIPAIVVLGLQRHQVLTVPSGATGLVARFRIPLHLDRSALRAVTLAPGLVVAGIGTWMTYLWARWGDPIAFVTNQRVYHPEDLPLLKRAFVSRWLRFDEDPVYALTIAGQALVVVFVICMIPAVCRRLGFAYGLYLAILVGIPTVSTGDFMGTGRYLIAAFPAFAVFGERLHEHPRARIAWLGASGLLMVGLAAAFSRSVYLT